MLLTTPCTHYNVDPPHVPITIWIIAEFLHISLVRYSSIEEIHDRLLFSPVFVNTAIKVHEMHLDISSVATMYLALYLIYFALY